MSLFHFRPSPLIAGYSQPVAAHDPEKQNTINTRSFGDNSASDSDSLDIVDKNEKEIEQNPDQVTQTAQPGVAKAEAAALVWTKPALVAIYLWIWVCFFMLALQSSVAFNALFDAYATFSSAPQVATANVLAGIIGGITKLPIAKLLNIWGRAEGFLVFVTFYIVGIIIIASSSGPSSYAAGYVIYYIGYSNVYFILSVFVADTSGLRNRAFSFGFVGTPFICTAFTGPLAAQHIILQSGWRWAYGIFAIVMPFVLGPLAIAFKFYQKKAEKLGVYKRTESGRTMLQSVVHYIHEFGVIGAFILTAAFVLFLLPFSLTEYGQADYNSATFIAMVVIGFVLFFVFAAWEKWFARVHFVRWELFKQRTVLGGCVNAAVLYFSFYSWDLYFYYFCEVVYNLSISNTGYMTQIYNVGSTLTGPIFGLYVRWSNHFKYAVLFFALPLMFLGAGLQVKYRGENTSDIGLLIMCQIFISVAGGMLVIGDDMAVMAAADRDGVPMMLALLNLSASIGGAIGDATTAAIFANTFPKALASRLPASDQDLVYPIYLGGSVTQLTYPVGTPIRDAINYAWSRSQYYNTIAAVCILVLSIPAIGVWKNYNVAKHQNKGLVV